ncbi:hypothetical protein Tco_1343704 [Tanacetum coccineum]
MEQFQVNTKFLNSLPPEWSKFVIDVKLVKDLHTSSFDQLHAYLEQHELHENEVRIMRERNQYPLAFVLLQGFLLPIISSELPLIQETKPLFKMVRLPYNKFRGDKGKIILVQHIKAMLLVQGEIQQVDKLELLNATTAKVKDIWLANDSAKREGISRFSGVHALTISSHNAAFQNEDIDTMIMIVMISRLYKAVLRPTFQLWFLKLS